MNQALGFLSTPVWKEPAGSPHLQEIKASPQGLWCHASPLSAV